ncbi:hypothetical protein SGLAM104S_03056 [Streptomyces glaucescens]
MARGAGISAAAAVAEAVPVPASAVPSLWASGMPSVLVSMPTDLTARH